MKNWIGARPHLKLHAHTHVKRLIILSTPFRTESELWPDSNIKKRVLDGLIPEENDSAYDDTTNLMALFGSVRRLGSCRRNMLRHWKDINLGPVSGTTGR